MRFLAGVPKAAGLEEDEEEQEEGVSGEPEISAEEGPVDDSRMSHGFSEASLAEMDEREALGMQGKEEEVRCYLA